MILREQIWAKSLDPRADVSLSHRVLALRIEGSVWAAHPVIVSVGPIVLHRAEWAITHVPSARTSTVGSMRVAAARLRTLAERFGSYKADVGLGETIFPLPPDLALLLIRP